LILNECGQGDSYALRKAALKLYALGYGLSLTAAILNKPKNTIKSWIYRYNKGNPPYRSDIGVVGNRPFVSRFSDPLRYRNAVNPAEWRAILQRQTEENARLNELPVIEEETKRAYLICGTLNIRKGPDVLAAIVQNRLGLDPFSGHLFAFCSKSRCQLKYIEWDGTGFRICARRLEYGTIPWPDEKMGKVLEVSMREFDFLLCGATPKQYMITQNVSKIMA
jgi:transposase